MLLDTRVTPGTEPQTSADGTRKSSAVEPGARFRALALVILGAYALLVGLHRGEFFPFSIFPMFSGAGRPWVRATVRDLEGETATLSCAPVPAEELPGQPFAISTLGLDQKDLSNFLLPRAKGPVASDVVLLERMFDAPRRTRELVIYRARGAREPDGSIQVRYQPLAALGPSGTRTVAGCVQ
jgi:hypothetical protein